MKQIRDDSRGSVKIEIGTPLDLVEKVMILGTLEATKDNQVLAARLLGISVKTLQRKLKKYSLPLLGS